MGHVKEVVWRESGKKEWKRREKAEKRNSSWAWEWLEGKENLVKENLVKEKKGKENLVKGNLGKGKKGKESLLFQSSF